ncbi:MAG: hypothetical protein Q9M30_07610 [Mariprofundaceae bacterium]|nr:hypothetical protein [Mariprofundaceae bacterium]
MKYLVLSLMLLLTACAGHHASPPEAVQNPYQLKAESMARAGVNAMGRGKMMRAVTLFEQSLKAATLADHAPLISLAWYNLGRARSAAGDVAGAADAFRQAAGKAAKAGDAVGRQRAELALALLETAPALRGIAAAGESSDLILRVPDDYPIDVHLAAARLAVAKAAAQPGRTARYVDIASHAYMRVLEKAGADRAGLIYAARAHLGLARLTSQSGGQSSGDSVSQAGAAGDLSQAMVLIHRAGAPGLMLEALTLAADMETDPQRQDAWLKQAGELRQALKP